MGDLVLLNVTLVLHHSEQAALVRERLKDLSDIEIFEQPLPTLPPQPSPDRKQAALGVLRQSLGWSATQLRAWEQWREETR